jgi:metallo-beta-lactamase class B
MGVALYVAGSFNGWNPGSAAHALTRVADGTYEITLPAVTGSIDYKFTRGSWATVESAADNTDVANRRYTFGTAPAIVAHEIINWKDLGASSPPASTANANVQVMATAFAMPQLNGRTRRVWLYLPTGYADNPARRYPVLYLQDGQNVFDAATSFSGEWGVDETLAQLQASGLSTAPCIVVAVDNGTGRLDEYSPWRNEQYKAGGEGDKYVEFLVETLKPYIDANYRTEPGRASTGIGGSSMGALIATYAALKYPAVFGKVAAFSPAYWFAQAPLFDYVRQHPANPDTRFYFVSGAGTNEGQTMVPLMTAMRDALLAGGGTGR